MVTLIRKLFIKDYLNVEDANVREKHGSVASIFGMITNVVLFGIKFVIGIIAASISIISDAINNLTDLFSNVASLIGFKIANKPADKKHPYGHERVEYITGMIISFIIIAVGIILGYTAITKLISHEVGSNYDIWAFIVLAVAILGKIMLGLFNRGMGKAINSISLKASMQDSFNDAISTGLVFVAALIQYFVGDSVWWLDPAMSIGIGIFIIYSGVKLVLETSAPLIGLSPESDFVKNIVNDVMSFEGALGIHDIVCHSYGPTKKFITLHVEVDGYENVMELHDLIDNIENTIREKYQCEITIHMDPIDTKNKEIPLLKSVIEDVLSRINTEISFHDLRLVAGPTHTNVLFDIVVPPIKGLDGKMVVEELKKEIKKVDKKYFLVVKVDNSYCH